MSHEHALSDRESYLVPEDVLTGAKNEQPPTA